jgi:Fur family ferric uptake transcriptional regulator
MTSQQAHAYLRDSGDPVGLSTVYRTLSALSDAGILHVLDAADEARYRRCGGEVHVHLLCTACGKVTTDADPELPSLLQRAARRQRLRPTAFRIEIEGVCLDCAMP